MIRRSYKQYCGIARALDLVGERWALLVIRELVFGPKRFTDLREGLPGIATNVLTQRVRQLERDGIITRRQLRPPAASNVYELTGYGRDVIPILLALGRWGARTMGRRSADHTLRSEWLAVALKAFHQPTAAEGLAARVMFDLGDATFTFTMEGGQLHAAPGVVGESDLTVAADPETLVSFLSGAPVTVRAEGDRELLERLPAIFPLGRPPAEHRRDEPSS